MYHNSIYKNYNKYKRKEILDELLYKAKELDCKHYEKFQKELYEIKSSKRKSSKERLHDYYQYIINEKTGAKIGYPDEPDL